MSIQIMSISYDESENGIPALCICSEMSFPITNKTFVTSFINYFTNDLKFKINSLSGNKISFKWYNEKEDILELYHKNIFVGYVCGYDLIHVFFKISDALDNLK